MDGIRAAEVVLPCTGLEETVRFFTERLGFRVDAVMPADDPVVTVVSGHGVRLRLDSNARGPPGRLRLLCDDVDAVAGGERTLTAPNGTLIELAEAEPEPVLPPLAPSFVVNRASDDAAWITGRAGMQYRDLVPDRQGGRFIASHIRIPDGGPVPDYVHFHRVRFQMIFCRRGWVRVVYEDQGEPFVMRAGDCVLQPPRIRHRVLESSPGLEVVEISSPAQHETLADHELLLPTPTRRPGRLFGGQVFVRHEAATATWQPWRTDGFESRDLGIAAATDGLAGAQVVRASGPSVQTGFTHAGEFVFVFVLNGAATLDGYALGPGDALVIPPGDTRRLRARSLELEFLEVTLPAIGDG